MGEYRPKEAFTTTLELWNPAEAKKVKGVPVKDYKMSGIINCLFKTYGGTETEKNGLLSVVDTANVETWYRPDITAASRVMLGEKVYEVTGEPEDINQRHQYLKFKVRRVKGGA